MSENNETEKEMNILTKAASRLKDTVSAAALEVKNLFSADFLSGFLISSFKEAVSQLREIERITNQIKKADRSFTKTDLAGFKTKALETAARYGTSPTDYLNDILEASRAGYKNADQIAELSTALQIAADISSEAALNIITTADSAWSLGGSVTELTKILNGLLGTAATGAVNMEQLAESFSLASERASGFGVSSDRTAAATGTLITAAGMDAEEAADALASIISVINGSYQNCLSTGSNTADSFAAACSRLGVSLSETKNGITSMRDPIQIVNELADACSRLSSSDPARISLADAFDTADASGTASATFNALADNSESYRTMLAGYSDSGADIISEAEKQVTSLDGALGRLSATWTATVENINDSGAATAFINTANGLLASINGITKALGPLGTLGLGAGLASGIMNTGKRRASARIS